MTAMERTRLLGGLFDASHSAPSEQYRKISIRFLDGAIRYYAHNHHNPKKCYEIRIVGYFALRKYTLEIDVNSVGEVSLRRWKVTDHVAGKDVAVKDGGKERIYEETEENADWFIIDVCESFIEPIDK